MLAVGHWSSRVDFKGKRKKRFTTYTKVLLMSEQEHKRCKNHFQVPLNQTMCCFEYKKLPTVEHITTWQAIISSLLSLTTKPKLISCRNPNLSPVRYSTWPDKLWWLFQGFMLRHFRFLFVSSFGSGLCNFRSESEDENWARIWFHIFVFRVAPKSLFSIPKCDRYISSNNKKGRIEELRNLDRTNRHSQKPLCFNRKNISRALRRTSNQHTKEEAKKSPTVKDRRLLGSVFCCI